MNPKFPVLTYHRVGKARFDWESPLCVEPERFREQMRYLAAEGRTACTLRQWIDWHAGRAELKPGAFLITFDDGFVDVHEHAAPVLLELGWSAAVFLVSGLVGQSDLWNRVLYPDGVADPLLSIEQIRELQAAGFEFESHSRTHPRLTRLDDAHLHEEIAGAKLELESMLRRPVTTLAYPFGDVDDRVVRAARNAGYECGFCCTAGLNGRDTDVMRMRRIDLRQADGPVEMERKLRWGSNHPSVRAALDEYSSRAFNKVTRHVRALVR